MTSSPSDSSEFFIGDEDRGDAAGATRHHTPVIGQRYVHRRGPPSPVSYKQRTTLDEAEVDVARPVAAIAIVPAVTVVLGAALGNPVSRPYAAGAHRSGIYHHQQHHHSPMRPTLHATVANALLPKDALALRKCVASNWALRVPKAAAASAAAAPATAVWLTTRTGFVALPRWAPRRIAGQRSSLAAANQEARSEMRWWGKAVHFSVAAADSCAATTLADVAVPTATATAPSSSSSSSSAPPPPPPPTHRQVTFERVTALGCSNQSPDVCWVLLHAKRQRAQDAVAVAVAAVRSVGEATSNAAAAADARPVVGLRARRAAAAAAVASTATASNAKQTADTTSYKRSTALEHTLSSSPSGYDAEHDDTSSCDSDSDDSPVRGRAPGGAAAAARGRKLPRNYRPIDAGVYLAAFHSVTGRWVEQPRPVLTSVDGVTARTLATAAVTWVPSLCAFVFFGGHGGADAAIRGSDAGACCCCLTLPVRSHYFDRKGDKLGVDDRRAQKSSSSSAAVAVTGDAGSGPALSSQPSTAGEANNSNSGNDGGVIPLDRYVIPHAAACALVGRVGHTATSASDSEVIIVGGAYARGAGAGLVRGPPLVVHVEMSTGTCRNIELAPGSLAPRQNHGAAAVQDPAGERYIVLVGGVSEGGGNRLLVSVVHLDGLTAVDCHVSCKGMPLTGLPADAPILAGRTSRPIVRVLDAPGSHSRRLVVAVAGGTRLSLTNGPPCDGADAVFVELLCPGSAHESAHLERIATNGVASPPPAPHRRTVPPPDPSSAVVDSATTPAPRASSATRHALPSRAPPPPPARSASPPPMSLADVRRQASYDADFESDSSASGGRRTPRHQGALVAARPRSRPGTAGACSSSSGRRVGSSGRSSDDGQDRRRHRHRHQQEHEPLRHAASATPAPLPRASSAHNSNHGVSAAIANINNGLSVGGEGARPSSRPGGQSRSPNAMPATTGSAAHMSAVRRFEREAACVLPERLRMRLTASRDRRLTSTQVGAMADRLCPPLSRKLEEIAALTAALTVSMKADFEHVPLSEQVAPVRRLAPDEMGRLYDTGVARKKRARAELVDRLTKQAESRKQKVTLNEAGFRAFVDRVYTKRLGSAPAPST